MSCFLLIRGLSFLLLLVACCYLVAHPVGTWTILRAKILGAPFVKREASMGPLGARKHARRWVAGRCERGMHLHIQALMAHQLDTGSTRAPATPISPQQWLGANHLGMQKQAHLARLRGGMSLPLTLLAQRAGTTAANAGSIDQAETPVGLRAPFLHHQ